MTKQLIEGLQTSQNNSLRNILRIPEVISSEELWSWTNQTPKTLVVTEVRRRKWEWTGYALRRDERNIAQ